MSIINSDSDSGDSDSDSGDSDSDSDSDCDCDCDSISDANNKYLFSSSVFLPAQSLPHPGVSLPVQAGSCYHAHGYEQLGPQSGSGPPICIRTIQRVIFIGVGGS